MPKFHIVTDSGALVGDLLSDLDPPVTIVSNSQAPQRSIGAPLSSVYTPCAEDYMHAFLGASRTSEAILCVTPSRNISRHWEHAQTGARQATGTCPIHIFDSQSMSAAQSLLILRAAEILRSASTVDDVAHQLRGLLTHSYTLIYVDQVEHLSRAGILSQPHTFFSAMLGVKPLLAIENGQLRAVEKTRTRGQAIERIHEFASEFGQHAHIVIQHDHISADAAQRLHEHLMSELEGQCDIFVYNSSISAQLGVGAIIVAILETVME